ncbi:MAG: hypothetical protein H7Y59_11250 [Anaerolineales bacterium]|nr:hypothetical protein [Anaerolineales bacterium]
MTDKEEDQRIPICPSCGQPFTVSLLDKVKLIFFILLLGYVVLSMILLVMSVPAELRRHQTNPLPPWDSWLQPFSNEPIFKIFVGGSVLIGVLILYWDWLQNIYKNWQMKRGNPLEKREKVYKYICHSCGQQWD